ncbi:ferritin-like domain-containing protein [Campylobacter mucosalis]|uniref:ferritin-like domain-containing protein n=1 Tax=Campylobacter mucosalis TaxID=202 RepID=UPI0014704C27|nr:ferritin-like domain-containing protein [Campylobacter mucosalis]QKF63010.1 DUF455 domain-containing protein [Campylobacter mucosalis]
MDFFEEIWGILNEGDIELKFLKFKQFYLEFKNTKDINFTRKTKARELENPSYFGFCDVVSMKNLNKKVPKEQKDAHFIHSVAHIEFSAIDIALDAVYRFDDLPREYYEDWLEVADDEIRHFRLISDLLAKKGVKYGDFQVHDGLFVALKKTQNSLVERMALLPRYMEANGLDANAHIIKKLSEQSGYDELISVLKVILKEEVSHVSKGNRWFGYACKRSGVDVGEYINIIRNLYPNSFINVRELNEADRLKAGFLQSELDEIKSLGGKR